MNELTTRLQTKELEDFIYETVFQYYGNYGKGILLANLGWAIFHQRPHLRDCLGKRKISEFIAQEMPEKIQVAPSVDNSAVKIATPVFAPKTIEVQNIKQITSAVKSRRFYAGAVFLAFSHPLASGLQRILTIKPVLYFKDMPVDSPLTAEGYRITSEFIVDISGNKNSTPLLDEKIDQWLKVNNLSLKELLRLNKPAHAKQKSLLSALDILISALGEDDLRRIQIPLDIISKLQKTIN